MATKTATAKADIQFESCGSIVMMQPLNKRGIDWINEKVSYEAWQVMGTAIAVDHRMAEDLKQHAKDDGLTVN